MNETVAFTIGGRVIPVPRPVGPERVLSVYRAMGAMAERIAQGNSTIIDAIDMAELGVTVVATCLEASFDWLSIPYIQATIEEELTMFDVAHLADVVGELARGMVVVGPSAAIH